ncbi:hypothetical protein Vadar_032479 [Vaccinium darrowii]|uniref:Uncharacterized protein n=1 Tax=Vaccinium darrowii TaxID=229202 RepID=A0ACB7YHN4_9ERIC|nr:hypothetical protein Vadar_032479 [Vaccinium darrowii]
MFNRVFLPHQLPKSAIACIYRYAQYCNLFSINVETAKTGRFVKGYPEFEVVINNTCRCTQSELVLSCDGFTSYVPLRLEVLRPVEEGCLVNDGKPVYGNGADPFKFKIAGTLPTKNFAPVSSHISCYAHCCNLFSISVETTKTGRVVKGYPEFEVVINNTCRCSQSELVLSCDGFTSYVPLKLEVLRPVEEGCLVNDGKPIYGNGVDPFKFKIAGTLPNKNFAPVSSKINCPC